ncbi:MAG TPA: hypothetical protein VEW93_04220 [Acidimicrobiales bacterium]|nr:hypothetical protein [Acidimicrobiales bacterium]
MPRRTAPRHPTHTHRRSRRAVAVVVGLVAAVGLTVAGPGAPAGATTAPLVTADGIGLRIDETAVTGQVLDDLVAAADTAVADRLQDGAAAAASFFLSTPPDGVRVDYESDITFDMVPPSVALPDGGMTLTTEITDLVVEYYVYGQWWQPECWIWVTADPATATVETTVEADPGTPAAPLPLAPSSSSWSTNWPNESVSSWICNAHIANYFDWDAFTDLNDPASPASLIEDDMEGLLAGLADDMWVDTIAPVLDSLDTLGGFDLDLGQLRFEDHGLIATGDVDATAGVAIGASGPYPVGSTVDAGVSTNVNSLLAQRAVSGTDSDVIVSLHPNVANQFLTALTDHLNGGFGTTTTSNAIAATLVDPTLGACYDPGDWTVRLTAQAPPLLLPTGTGGRPELQLPQMSLGVRNSGCNPGDPRVATFSGAVTDIAAPVTGTPLQPTYDGSAAGWSATRTFADAATAARVPPATDADLVPWMRSALSTFFTLLVPDLADLDVGGLGGHSATHCTACGRYGGDQRVTETFHLP